MQVSKRKCTACGGSGPFYALSVRCGLCKACKSLLSKDIHARRAAGRTADEKRARLQFLRSYNNTRRADPDKQAYHLCKDSKASDRRAGRDNDLTVDFVQALLSLACHYCGATTLRMTLDRKHSHLGHLQTNVVPCCVRCNFIKLDLPYDVWLLLLPGVKAAVISGAFGEWEGFVNTRKKFGE